MPSNTCWQSASNSVSIHAPRCRGAMPVCRPGRKIWRGFVSIHAPRCRGAMPSVPLSASLSYTVSIHAPRCRGAMRHHPAHRAGNNGFNPRPPLPRGDAAGASLHYYESIVSIHAPRCRGAMRKTNSDPLMPRMFQSTPPVAEGRCAALLKDAPPPEFVSIHAPRCRGAMRGAGQLKNLV